MMELTSEGRVAIIHANISWFRKEISIWLNCVCGGHKVKLPHKRTPTGLKSKP